MEKSLRFRRFSARATSVAAVFVAPLVLFATVSGAVFATGSATAFASGDEQAIAHWDVVPYQDFVGYFQVGVVAFHMNGIDRVDFSVNGSPAGSAKSMTLNPRTDVVEYWTTIDARAFADGPVRVQATAYPNDGVPRTLETLVLNADSHGTLREAALYVSTAGDDAKGDGTAEHPLRTIQAAMHRIGGSNRDVAGGVIYLLPGSYEFGGAPENFDWNSSTRWLTIRPAIGYSKDDVSLVPPASGRASLRAQKVRVYDVTARNVTFSTTGPLDDALWLDHVAMIGSDDYKNEFPTAFTNWSEKYATNSRFERYVNGIKANLVRRVVVNDIVSDAYSGSDMVVDSVASNIFARGTGAHSDVYQHGTGDPHNVIIYGLVATEGIQAQGIFADGQSSLRDVAYVNVRIDNQSVAPSAHRSFFLLRPLRHIYVKDSDFVGPVSIVSSSDVRDVYVEGSVFDGSPGESMHLSP